MVPGTTIDFGRTSRNSSWSELRARLNSPYLVLDGVTVKYTNSARMSKRSEYV